MSGIKIGFSVSPWLLLLIIPALAVIAAVFFIGRRRKRRTVNGVISCALQSVVAVMLIFALSGIYFYSENSAAQNELVILVDRSFTSRETEEQTDGFVREVLEKNGGRCRTAIVLFGYNQQIALEMGDYGAEEAYENYLSAVKTASVDDRATNIAGAVRLAYDPAFKSGSLITRPETAKILILSDGLQTDDDALGAIKNASRDGIQVDVAFYAAQTDGDASVTGITIPERNIGAGEEFEFQVNLKSAYEKDAVVILEDTDESGKTEQKSCGVGLKTGAQTLSFPYAFPSKGAHELVFRLEAGGDAVWENNIYYSFYDVAENNLMLIIEKHEGESSKFMSAVGESADSRDKEIKTALVSNVLSMTERDMEKYSEIVLYNIAASDMTVDFQRELYSYVNEFGGGLFTVGGFEKESDGTVLMRPKEREPETSVPVAHSYKEEDFEESPYSAMLPVMYDPYKPSVGIVFVIDVSSSMRGEAVYSAIRDAKHSLNLLAKNDYAGVIVLKDSYQQMTGAMVPMTRKDDIIQAIDDVVNSQGVSTYYEEALQQAVNMLKTCPADVVRKHIVLMSDGGPGDYFEDYSPIIENAHNTEDVTLTVMSYYEHKTVIDGETYYFNGPTYNTPSSAMHKAEMDALAGLGGGSSVFADRKSAYVLDEYLAKDLKIEELEEVGMHEFHPQAGTPSPVTDGVTGAELSSLLLQGFFPSRAKMEEGVEQPIMANASPLYAQWKFGAGKVGSIMIDLEGVWSAELLESAAGKKILSNIVSELFMRVEKAQSSSMEITLAEDNFRTQVNVYGYNSKKEPSSKLVAFVVAPDGGAAKKFDLSQLSTTRNRFEFENQTPGTYTIYVLKVNKNFDMGAENIKSVSDVPESQIIDQAIARRTFSYSKEYDGTANAYKTGQELLLSLSTRTAAEGEEYGKFIYAASEIFENYAIVREKTDLRPALMIASIATYLAGVALRKFKIVKRRKKVPVSA